MSLVCVCVSFPHDAKYEYIRTYGFSFHFFRQGKLSQGRYPTHSIRFAAPLTGYDRLANRKIRETSQIYFISLFFLVGSEANECGGGMILLHRLSGRPGRRVSDE